MATDVTFDKNGAELRVEIRIGHAQAGAYKLKLWDGNKVIHRWEGLFDDPKADNYVLPGKAAEHEGRLLQCRFGVDLIPPIKQYALLMTLWQGDVRIGVLSQSGETDAPEITRSLKARLVSA